LKYQQILPRPPKKLSRPLRELSETTAAGYPRIAVVAI
jgi:hypothetical protein